MIDKSAEHKEIKRGDIYWVKFAPPSGTETNGKKRPCVVISNDRQNLKGLRVIILPLSSKVKKIYRFDLFLGEVILNGKQSKAMVDQIRTLDRTKLLEKEVRLSGKLLEQIDEKLITLLALENKTRYFLLWKKNEN